MEQVLGHRSWYQNLRAAVTKLRGVEPRWIETELFDQRGRLERLRVVSPVIAASVRGLVDKRRGLQGWSPDVLFFNTQKPAAFCQWQMLRIPTILMTDVTPRQYDRLAASYDHTLDKNSIVRAVKHRVNALNFGLAGAVVAWSRWTADSLIHEYGVPPERVHLIPPGVDTDYWRPSERGTPGGPVKLLFVGGNLERKGGRLLLEAFGRGAFSRRAELHIVTRDSVPVGPDVVLHHDLENNSPALIRLYQQADIFVLPTMADCFSIASIEAMAAGLPVVATRVGGIPDIVIEGETGQLVPVGDGAALGAVLNRLVGDAALRHELGQAGRRRAVEQFNARRNAERIVGLAASLAS
jgi:glycosyltransferase involved in cell wall biosynthesis